MALECLAKIFDFTMKGSISRSAVSGASKSLPGMIAAREGQVKTGMTFSVEHC